MSTPGLSAAEVGDLLDRLPRHLTYTEMEAECARHFCDRWTWSRDRMIRAWKARHPIRKGRPSTLDGDVEVRAFVEDRLGRLTLDEIVVACRERFGDRAPSRSAVHRHWKKGRDGR